MVSIVKEFKAEREDKIASIVQALKDNPKQNLKNLTWECCSIFNCTERKAKEYISIAKWRLENASNL